MGLKHWILPNNHFKHRLAQFALFGRVWPHCELFGPVLPQLTQAGPIRPLFGLVWLYLAPFEPDWLNFSLFGSIWPHRINPYERK